MSIKNDDSESPPPVQSGPSPSVHGHTLRVYRCVCGKTFRYVSYKTVNDHRASHGSDPLPASPPESIPGRRRRRGRRIPESLDLTRNPIKTPKVSGKGKRKRLKKQIAELQNALNARTQEIRKLKSGLPPREMKKEPGFYESREWRELRYKALVKHGRTCQACGSHKPPMHVDHIKPRSKFPSLALDINNLQVLCVDCNLGKSNKDETDWRPR